MAWEDKITFTRSYVKIMHYMIDKNEAKFMKTFMTHYSTGIGSHKARVF